MRKRLKWEAFSGDDRTKVIGEVKSAIADSDGYIINFNMFSDLALSLSIEIEEKSLLLLHQNLSKTLRITPFDGKDINALSNKECLIFMNISFGSGKGNLKSEIPSVPG